MADGLECFAVVVQSSIFSCCGTILDSEAGIIITVGSIIKGLCQQNNEYVEKNGARLLEQDIPVEVIVKKPQKQASKTDFTALEGKLIAIWRDKKLEEICRNMFPSMEWTFEGDSNLNFVKEINQDCPNNFQERKNTDPFLADFALIEVKNLHSYLSLKLPLKNEERVTIGQPVTVIGTPFASECLSVFFNSVSKGIVSNVIESNNEMILTDARCVPGCEGCPVFLDSLPGRSSHFIFGIVVAPFCWRSGEWIGLTLVCSITHILKTLFKNNNLTKLKALKSSIELGSKLGDQTSISISPDNAFFSHVNQDSNVQKHHNCPNKCEAAVISDIVKNSRPCIVLIQCGTTWGSGIITDSKVGLVVTCRHILNEGGILKEKHTPKSASSCHFDCFENAPLIIHDLLSHSVYNDIEIMFATTQDCALDFALLRVKNHKFKVAIKFRDHFSLKDQYNNMFSKGEDLLAIGHSLFGSHLSSGPSITSGVISNVTYVHGIPVMLQSTAAVHCGGSGGAIVSRCTGELLGMVTSNIRDANSSSSFPHINFSIPSNLILRLTAFAMLPDVKKRSLYLDDFMSGIQNAWRLNCTRNSNSKL